MSAYPYLVKFDYNDQSYIAKSLESASGSSNAIFLERNLDRKVTVFFKPQDPKIVTIAVFKEMYILSLGMLLLGSLAISL